MSGQLPALRAAVRNSALVRTGRAVGRFGVVSPRITRALGAWSEAHEQEATLRLTHLVAHSHLVRTLRRCGDVVAIAWKRSDVASRWSSWGSAGRGQRLLAAAVAMLSALGAYALVMLLVER